MTKIGLQLDTRINVIKVGVRKEMSIIVMLNSVAYQLDHSLAQPSRIQMGTSQTQLCTIESGLYQLDH